NLTARDEDIIIEVPGDNDKDFANIRDTVSQVARLEFKMVDDTVDYFEQYSHAKDLPSGLSFYPENAPVGPGKSKVVHVARLLRSEHEDMRDTLKRFKEWVSTLQVDPDHEIGFQKFEEYDEEKDVYEEKGWRSYYLFSKAEITGDQVTDAQAEPDQERGVGGWRVRMHLTPVGGDR